MKTLAQKARKARRANRAWEKSSGIHALKTFQRSTDMGKLPTREDYLARFPTLGDAISFENSVLSAGFLPEYAEAVRTRSVDEPDPRYWGFLISQIDA